MLVITLGEPHSVNIEAVAALLASAPPRPWPLAVVGSHWHWRDQCERLGVAPAVTPVADFEAALGKNGPPPLPLFIDVGGATRPAETLSAAERGEIATSALYALRRPSLASFARLAVVTGPIDKQACRAAGFEFPGQTEFFESLWQGRAVMTLAGPRLRVGLATNHLALRQVPERLTTALVGDKIVLLSATLKESFGIMKPRLAVCGLNPHSGDGGLFGDEEARVIVPAIDSAKAALAKSGIDAAVSGPWPADTAFYRAYNGAFDGVLAMYHDQGLGPLKTVHFDDAVNLSGGLRHLRVSPDHGPAADLFLTRQASASCWQACFKLASAFLAGGAVGR
jgi:4-hydroxythreonine-4-phosphate dehydrogenase